jgi:hypothetical protein
MLYTNKELLQLRTDVLNNKESVFFVFCVGGNSEQPNNNKVSKMMKFDQIYSHHHYKTKEVRLFLPFNRQKRERDSINHV